jgi:uncharacterized protein YjbJ (UPF0337 family)
MTWEEVEGRWEEMDRKVEAKWGKLTRTERTVLAGRWQKRNDRLGELYDLSEEEAHRAVVAGHHGAPG